MRGLYPIAMPPATQPTVLVTGASSGIGAATAQLLATDGWRVFGTSRRPRAAADAGIRWVRMDVCDEASVRDGVAAVVAEVGHLDALVCNAGVGIFGSVEEVPLPRARAQFETNVFGVLGCIRAVLPAMRAAGRGRIVVVGSLAGRAPIPFQAHYSATKAAVDALVQGLRMEVAPFGVRVALIEPGDIRTAFNDATDWGDITSSPYGARIRMCERVVRESLERAPGPEGIARTIRTALTTPRPRTRYPAGPSAWAVALCRRFLPDALVQRMIRAHFGV